MKKKVCDDMDQPEQLAVIISQLFEKRAIKD